MPAPVVLRTRTVPGEEQRNLKMRVTKMKGRRRKRKKGTGQTHRKVSQHHEGLWALQKGPEQQERESERNVHEKKEANTKMYDINQKTMQALRLAGVYVDQGGK